MQNHDSPTDLQLQTSRTDKSVKSKDNKSRSGRHLPASNVGNSPQTKQSDRLSQRENEMYDQQPSEASRPIISNFSEVVNNSALLVSSVESLVNQLSSCLDKATVHYNSANRSVVKKSAEARTALSDMKNITSHATSYIESVEDTFFYGKSDRQLEEVMNGLKCNNLEPLKTFVDRLQRCFSKTEELYQQFEEACNESKNSLVKASEFCKLEARCAKDGEFRTKMIGGGATALGGAATLGVCVLAGIGTFGIGTLLAMGAIAAVSTGATGYYTCHSVTQLQQAVKELEKLETDFNDMEKFASKLQSEVDIVKCKLNSISRIVDELKGTEENCASLFDSMDLLSMKFEEYYTRTKSCRQNLQTLSLEN